MIVSVIIGVVGVGLCGTGIYLIHHTHQINKDIDASNTELLAHNSEILKEQAILNNNKEMANEQLKQLRKELDNIKDECMNASNKVKKAYQDQTDLCNSAFDNYTSLLEKQYSEVDAEYENYKKTLSNSYLDFQTDINNKMQSEKEQLDKIRETRRAAQEAIVREQKIKENLSFYCLQISEIQLSDIKMLNKVKSSLNQPRILNMLIWQTYFQKPLKTLAAKVLGSSTVCGIYKITNQQTQECYIGQSVDVAKRWSEHAKCGLGIDAPAKNKLYAAMQEYGLWNFSWELLEKCPKEQLDEKEKYYIELYMANDCGYNSTKGNK